MFENITAIPFINTIAGLLVVLLASYLSLLITKRIVLKAIARFVLRTKGGWDDVFHEYRVFERLAGIGPALVIYYGAKFVPGVNPDLQLLIQRFATAAMVAIVLASASGVIDAVSEIYSKYPVAKTRPIKGYLQVTKIIVFALGAVVIVALLIDQSPFLLLSGVGALTAVLLLIFKDTILSLVASVQITSNDMVRVGDWIEMPQYMADGDVIDIALHTVKVQNWDKTITTIPTYKLIDDSFKNWRGMSASGGRRIKRSINLDVNTIRFLQEEDLQRFEKFHVLDEYIRGKRKDLEETNEDSGESVVVNSRRLTNIGTFRAYIAGYLHAHPAVHDNMTFLIRQMEPGVHGVPIQIYVFSNNTEWVAYEALQSDIFDHLLAVVPEFGLRVFQNPTGADFRGIGGWGGSGAQS